MQTHYSLKSNLVKINFPETRIIYSKSSLHGDLKNDLEFGLASCVMAIRTKVKYSDFVLFIILACWNLMPAIPVQIPPTPSIVYFLVKFFLKKWHYLLDKFPSHF